MATVKNNAKGPAYDLTPVETNHNVRGGANRNPPQVKIKRSGYSETNTEGTDLVIGNLGQFGIKGREGLKFRYSANPNTGLVGFTIIKVDDVPGSQQIRDAGNILYFHIGGVFKEYPEMRPAYDVVCGLSLASDAQGNPCFVFNLKTGAPATGRRKKSSSNSSSEAQKQLAPGQQEPPKTE